MAKKFPHSFRVRVSVSKIPIKKSGYQVVFDESEIKAWREEQMRNIRVQEKFLREVKRHLGKSGGFRFGELVKEYEAYVEKVKEGLE